MTTNDVEGKDVAADEPEDLGGLDVCKGVSCTRTGLIGEYDWSWLCTPSLNPFSQKKLRPPLFLGKDEPLALGPSLVFGLQHALAMLGGILTPPLLIANDACFPWQYDEELCGSREYLISASLFVSGLLSIMQIVRVKLCTYVWLRGPPVRSGLLLVTHSSRPPGSRSGQASKRTWAHVWDLRHACMSVRSQPRRGPTRGLDAAARTWALPKSHASYALAGLAVNSPIESPIKERKQGVCTA